MAELPEPPELPASLQWLEQPQPPRLDPTLRGHVVVLLFWRLGCIHSLHALADLERLHRAFAGRAFAGLAVHSPQLDGERDLDRLRRRLTELDVGLAVAVDAGREAMHRFGASAWPTLVLIDAAGSIRFHGRGEPDFDRLHGAVDRLLLEAAAQAQSASQIFVPQRLSPAPRRALQPTRLCLAEDVLWIADTGNHRLLAVDADSGALQLAVGSRRGFEDGAAAAARLCLPRGLCVVDDGTMLVADCGNHALRAVDRGTGLVRTVCGSGQRGSDHFGGGFGIHQGLSSPSDLCRHDHATYVAMTGAHQLWQFDAETQGATAWLGTGEQALRDGSEAAGLAQPQALAAGADQLLVADAGNGAVRTVDLAHGRLGTRTAALQRPDGVALHRGEVLVADRWAGRVYRLAGNVPVALLDRSAGIMAPSGMVLRGDLLLIADPVAGCIWQLDLAAGQPASTLQAMPLSGLPPPA